MQPLQIPASRVDWRDSAEELRSCEYAQYPKNALAPAPENAPDDYKRKPHHFAGKWFARTPNGLLVNLSGHEIVEESNGSITVSPALRVGTERDGTHIEWRGYLTHGMWIVDAPPSDLLEV